MARIFVTGSSDGIGQHLARALIAQGHSVTLHARNTARGETAVATVPGAEGILIGDLSSIVDVKALAAEANKTGIFDTVFHNAGVGFRDDYHKSADGLPMEFAVNVLATYLLTALITKSKNLVYMSSGMHSHGDGSLEDVSWSSGRAWDGMQAYSDSKLYDVMLAFAVARHWPDVTANAMAPGWVRTKMGGSSAPGSMDKAIDLSIRLTGSTSKSEGSGKYFSAQGSIGVHPDASNVEKQEKLLKICEELSGVPFPRK